MSNNKSRLTQEEIALWANFFNKIDSDNDGKISIVECVSYLRTQYKKGDLDKFNFKKFEHIISHAPVNAEKKFEFETFKTWIHHHGEQKDDDGNTSGSESDMTDTSTSSSDEEAETMHQLFDAIDLDQNGYITLDEMIQMEKLQSEELGQIFDEPKRREELRHFMRMGDMDRDHRLSFQEFMMAMKKRAQDGSAFYSDSETDLENSDVKNRRELKKRSTKRKLERRRSKKIKGMMKMAGVNKKELKVRTETKDDRINLSDYDVCARLRQIFDTLDNDGDDYISCEELVSLEPHLKNYSDDRSHIDVAERKTLLRKIHQQHADDDKLITFQQFMTALHSLRLTNEQLKNTWDSVLWSKQKQRIDVSDVDVADIDSGLTTLRESILKTDEEPASSALTPRHASQGEIKQLKEQLELALRLADALREKFEASQNEVGRLTSELQNYKRIGNLPPPPEIVENNNQMNGNNKTTKQPPRQRRSHAERNQEFFYLTALAVKLNVEAKYRDQQANLPHMLSTKKLYETAMAVKVPFQFYYKWVEKQIDPHAHHHHHHHKSNGKKK